MVEKKKIRSWSRLGQSGTACGVAIYESIEEYSNIYVITADLGVTAGLKRVMDNYPDRFINVGIAEQSLIGVASGMAFEDNNVFAVSFATFLTMRGYEQIRHNLGYQKANVKLLGISAGVAMGMFGNTHYAIEDIAIMRAIPNMLILSPADALEAYYCIKAMSSYIGPAYIRLSDGVNSLPVYDEDYDFAIGKAVTLRSLSKINIIATGRMVHEAIAVSDIFKEKEISIGVINMHTIKPIDEEILKTICNSQLIFSIEEHSVIGGLGSAISDYYDCLDKRPRIEKIGIHDVFPTVGNKEYVRKECGLYTDAIVKRIENIRVEFYSNL